MRNNRHSSDYIHLRCHRTGVLLDPLSLVSISGLTNHLIHGRLFCSFSWHDVISLSIPHARTVVPVPAGLLTGRRRLTFDTPAVVYTVYISSVQDDVRYHEDTPSIPPGPGLLQPEIQRPIRLDLGSAKRSWTFQSDRFDAMHQTLTDQLEINKTEQNIVAHPPFPTHHDPY